MEAAAAYYEVTGKDRLLHVMERMAEHIEERFGTEEGKEPGIPGHHRHDAKGTSPELCTGLQTDLPDRGRI